MADNARSRALVILGRWEKEQLPLDLVIEEEMQRPFAEPRDFQFCRALVFGVVRWRGYLDALLARLSKHPPAKMKPLTRQALRCGLYQMLVMDRVPVSAAINETVRLLKEAGQPVWLTGFVNGVLRRVSREKADLPQPGDCGSAASSWPRCDLLSHPSWLYERWVGRYGREVAEAICNTNNLEANLTLRVTVKIGREALLEKLRALGIAAEAGAFAPSAIVLHGYHGPVAALPGYADGLFQVQDEAAQLVSLMFGDLAQGSYLDACAGLGGKTTHLAELLGDGAKLLAVEPESRRFVRLGENLSRLGLSKVVETFNGTLTSLVASGERRFQGILIDVPCSGLGVIRRHPDIRWNRLEPELGHYQAGQLALLTEAAPLLASGGVLLYATCSTEPEENEMVVELFLAGHQDFRVEDCREFLPVAAREFAGDDGFFRTRPYQGLDGFFAARFCRKK